MDTLSLDNFSPVPHLINPAALNMIIDSVDFCLSKDFVSRHGRTSEEEYYDLPIKRYAIRYDAEVFNIGAEDPLFDLKNVIKLAEEEMDCKLPLSEVGYSDLSSIKTMNDLCKAVIRALVYKMTEEEFKPPTFLKTNSKGLFAEPTRD